jgi:RNA polymerase sigma-B factor
VPRSLQERFLKINDAIDQLSGRLGARPTPRDIAAHTGFTLEEVLEALDASTAYTPTPLDAPFPGDADADRTLGDSLGSEEPGYEFVEMNHAIGPAFRALPEREQTIMRLRFVEDLTQSEIAEKVGVSQMHVSRLLRRSIERLSAAADGRDAPGAAA